MSNSVNPSSLPPNNGKTLLITGLSGYIASTIALLEGPYQLYASRISVLEVPDMTIQGAFDSAVQGVHAIFHTASPVNISNNSWATTIAPAIGGTNSLLNSAFTHAGPQLEALIVTSSATTASNPSAPPGAILDEASWNIVALATANEQGDSTPPMVLYRASKVAAERAVWEFRDQRKPPFAITTICPTYVIGPPIHLPHSPSHLNQTLATVAKIFLGYEIEAAIGSGQFVDVRDVARLHIAAYEAGPAISDGQRFFAIAGKGSPQAMADLLRDMYPERAAIIPTGEPGHDYVRVEMKDGRSWEVAYKEEQEQLEGSHSNSRPLLRTSRDLVTRKYGAHKRNTSEQSEQSLDSFSWQYNFVTQDTLGITRRD
ncbi:hypothetical protein DL769_005553 [Monosporascus sp. CRB-8-3]|nr:hypothetical protein DL769_005553 [Monosporascus sp. CRB-8-3]